MASIFFNGGLIGTTLDYGANNSNDRYIIGYTQVRDNLTFVGGQTQSISGAAPGTNTTVNFNLSGGIATTPSANDLVIVAYGVGTGSNIVPSLGVTGYLPVRRSFSPDTFSTAFDVYYKFMGSTPDTSFVRTPTGNTAHGGAVTVHVWRNVDQNTPFDVASTFNTINNTALVNPPAITPTTTNTRILIAGAAGHNSGGASFTASYLSNFITNNNDDTVDATVGMGWVAWTSGAYDGAAWTFSGTDRVNHSYASTVMALRPKLIDIPTYGNLKNSGIWNLESVYEYRRSQYTPPGDIAWAGAGGTSYWRVPPGVSNVFAIVIGAGGGGSGADGGRNETNGGGGGGACAWGNFDVTPGEILTIVVGQYGLPGGTGGSGSAGGASSISRGATVLLSGGGGGGGIERNAGTAAGGTSTGTVRQGGGNGGNGGAGTALSGGTGGGGAGGPGGNGGNGGGRNAAGSAGATNSGAGGGGGGVAGTSGTWAGGGGGASGFGLDLDSSTNAGGIAGGGGGQPNGLDGSGQGYGGPYGGGGGGADDLSNSGSDGGFGLVRIGWGPGRSFPSSNTGFV